VNASFNAIVNAIDNGKRESMPTDSVRCKLTTNRAEYIGNVRRIGHKHISVSYRVKSVDPTTGNEKWMDEVDTVRVDQIRELRRLD
jgi:hypothetical protein